MLTKPTPFALPFILLFGLIIVAPPATADQGGSSAPDDADHLPAPPRSPQSSAHEGDCDTYIDFPSTLQLATPASSPFYPRVTMQGPWLMPGQESTPLDFELFDEGASGTYATPLVEGTVNANFVARGISRAALLAVPDDGNDLFYLSSDYSAQRMGQGTQPLVYGFFAGDDAEHDLWTRFKALPSFGFFYDTGAVGTTDTGVSAIALGKSQSAGQTTFTGSGEELVPVSLLVDNQMRNLFGLDQQIQLYTEINNHRDREKVQLAHLMVRSWDFDDLTIGAGKSYSLFGVRGALPSTLSQTGELVGTGELPDDFKPLQVRLQASSPQGGWGWGAAIEESNDEDFDIPAQAVKLNRWPTFAGNVLYIGEDDVDRVQFATLVRTLGLETMDGREHFDTAWGLSAYAMLGTRIDEDSLQGFYVGTAGGDGVGSYISGIEKSAAFNGTRLQALDGVGAYAGYKRQWVTRGNKELGVNAAYGYAHLEPTAGVDHDTNRKLQQAWANVLYYPSRSIALGLEYQYGRRETIAAGEGENHRFLFVVALTSSTVKNTDETAALLGQTLTYSDGGQPLTEGSSAYVAPAPADRAGRQRF